MAAHQLEHLQEYRFVDSLLRRDAMALGSGHLSFTGQRGHHQGEKGFGEKWCSVGRMAGPPCGGPGQRRGVAYSVRQAQGQ